MKKILFTSPHIPSEWIAAHGLMPVRITPCLQSGGVREGACGYSEGFFDQLEVSRDFVGAIVAGVCDQMRRGLDLHESEIDIPVHLIHIPTTWQQSSSFELYKNELCALSDFLVQCGGVVPDAPILREALLFEEQQRELLKLTFESTPYRHYRKVMTNWYENRMVPPLPKCTAQPKRSIAILGGPLPDEELHLVDMMEPYGFLVALDGSETGFRAFPTPLDKRLVQEEPFEALCTIYWEGMHAVYQRPNAPLYQWFKKEESQYDLQGVLFIRWSWCDLWNAEIQRFSEWCDLPVVTIDFSGIDATARNKTRLEAFCESIS